MVFYDLAVRFAHPAQRRSRRGTQSWNGRCVVDLVTDLWVMRMPEVVNYMTDKA